MDDFIEEVKDTLKTINKLDIKYKIIIVLIIAVFAFMFNDPAIYDNTPCNNIPVKDLTVLQLKRCGIYN